MKLIEVKAVPPMMAEMMRDILSQEGKQTFLDPADEAYLRVAIGSGARPVRIMVDEKDLEKAKEILQSWDSGQAVFSEDDA